MKKIIAFIIDFTLTSVLALIAFFVSFIVAASTMTYESFEELSFVAWIPFAIMMGYFVLLRKKFSPGRKLLKIDNKNK